VLGNMRRRKGVMKIPFIILTIALVVGLIGSFIMWSVPSGSFDTVSGNAAAVSEAANQVQLLQQQIKDAQQALRGEPEDVGLLKQLAAANFQLGYIYLFEQKKADEGIQQFQAAIPTYQQILKLEAQSDEINLSLAMAAYFSGQKELADSSFQQALALNPENALAHFNYGLFLAEVKSDYQQAVKQWQQTEQLAKGTPLGDKAAEIVSQFTQP
jgi:tetratricopeptide (TPR) repeat protein